MSHSAMMRVGWQVGQVHHATSRRAHHGATLLRHPLSHRIIISKLAIVRAAQVEPPDNTSHNPLEALRSCKDRTQRATLLRELDGKWSAAFKRYEPTPTEHFLSERLGQTSYNCMLVAVQNPGLADLDPQSQVKPSISTLKAYNIDLPEIWHLVNKRSWIFAHPDNLQRWLDFLSVYGLRSTDLCQFLLRASQDLFINSTVHRAGLVITYLKTLGIKDEFLATRLVGLWPEVLNKDVDFLKTVVKYLMSLGMEIPDVLNVIMQWPEILIHDVEEQLKPFAGYLETLGCGPVEVAEVIMECPHLLQFQADQVFSKRMEMLGEIGVGREEVSRMVKRHTGFLAAKGGFKEQLEALREAGFGDGELREIVVACPKVLVENAIELTRKCDFLQEVLEGQLSDAVAHPTYLAANLMQVIGPRFYFAKKKDQLGLFTAESGKLDLAKMVFGSDEEFCWGMKGSLNEYDGFRYKWEKDYTQKINLESENSMKEELARIFAKPVDG